MFDYLVNYDIKVMLNCIIVIKSCIDTKEINLIMIVNKCY